MIADTIIREGEVIPTDIVLYIPPDASLAFPRGEQETTVRLWANAIEAMSGADITDIVVEGIAKWNPGCMSGVFTISGVTKDKDEIPIGGCVVDLYETVYDMKVASVLSDLTTGEYAFSGLSDKLNFYVVAYKQGSPDIAGTTVNTLVGS